MQSAHRTIGVTLEEVEDEDMPQIPRWGPHPFANPTPAHLYPEPHPDPTAGAALRFYPTDRSTPPLYTSVLAEPDTFREAYWLDHLPIPQSAEEEYFRLPRTRGWHWKNLKEFDDEVNRLPRGPRWFRETWTVTGDKGDEILDLWKRDIREMVVWLLSQRRLIPYTRYAPERRFDSPTKDNRVYDDMPSGDWWWRIQNILGRHATVAPIIISTDKTKMTIFSGNQKAWPVYMSLGNIDSKIRRQPSERATLLIGFIPVSNLSNISDADKKSQCGWQLFHSCMESILEPLKELSRTGLDVLCADGGLRRVFPILAAYIADFPEQATIACVRESRCPICWVPANERGDLSKRYPLRDRQRTLDALEDHWNGYSRTINVLGIRPTRPFWANLPYVDVSTCLTPDALHQLDKGVFGDHIVKWCTALLGANEMNDRTKGMPRFQKLRHFARGITVISQWTGKEAKALASTFLSIVAGFEKPKVVTAVRSIVDFMYRAHKLEISEDDLAMMEEDLLEFNKVKNVFIDPKIKDLPKSEEHFNCIPKIHMLSHYTYLIRQLGAPCGYNTEITERLHIYCVKEPWRATNHNNPIQQMISYLQRKEAWTLLRAYMHDTGLLLDSRFIESDADGDSENEGSEDAAEGDSRDGGLEDAREGDGEGDGDGVGGETWEPNPTIAIAKRPALGRQKGTYLINKHKATDLVPATVNFLRSIVPPGTSIPISAHSLFKVWRRCKLSHQRLSFYPALDPQTDQIRAFPASTDEEGRVIRVGFFDTVLFTPTPSDPKNQGLHQLQAGRVRAIFELPDYVHPFFPQKLVYIERFCPFSAHVSRSSLYTTSHAVHGGRRSVSVIPLSQLRMTCHLAPRYHLLDPDLRISSSTDLLSEHDSFYLNKHASYWLFAVLDYWEKQRRLNIDWLFYST
ncbi:hypothetical protein FRC06_006521 [Ceratobasidium sp. 370]|nr:hypothetical protein FRC06_006521 [Ceratobasidium sp. 370]